MSDYEELLKEQRVLSAKLVSENLQGKNNPETLEKYRNVQERIYEIEYLTDDKIQAFLSYMYDNFPEPMSNSFTRDLVENVVRYVYREKGQTSWAAKMMIVDLLPEINYEEVEDLLPKFGFREEN